MKPNEKIRSLIEEINSKGSSRILQIEVDRADDVGDDKPIYASMSSEEPYERWFGIEILSHKKGAIRMDRAKKGLGLFVAHDTQKLPIGRWEELATRDKKFGGYLRFSSRQEGQDARQDTIDGILTDMSAGYIVHEMKLVRETDGVSEYLVTDWTPLEGSYALPADHTVGVGRSYEPPAGEVREMTDEEKRALEAKAAQEQEERESVIAGSAAGDERKRMNEILKIGRDLAHVEGMTEMAEKAAAEETSLADFRANVVELMKDAKPTKDAMIGMSKKDLSGYSLFKAVRAQADRDWRKAGLELEASREVAKAIGKDPNGFFVPQDVLADPAYGRAQRDLSAGVDSAGGYLVGTDHLAGSFIDLLRKKSVIAMTGATMIDGLVGNIDIPKFASGASFYWIDNESEDTTESNPTFGNVVMTPRTISGRVDLTRRLLMQSSPSAEGLIRNDLSLGAALTIDAAALHGTGASGQPTGIAATTGIGDVAGGTNGLAPTWAHIVNLESELANDNADVGSLSYVTNSRVRGKLKQTEIAADTNAAFIWAVNAKELNGHPVYVSNQVSNTLTKGNQSLSSAIFFGNWADLIIAIWSGMDITADNVTLGDRGGLVLRVFQDVDVAVRHPESFAAMLDALTA